jgi:hypothetical protein
MRAAEFLGEALDGRTLYDLALHDIRTAYQEAATSPWFREDYGDDWARGLKGLIEGKLKGLTESLFHQEPIANVERVGLQIEWAPEARAGAHGIVKRLRGRFGLTGHPGSPYGLIRLYMTRPGSDVTFALFFAIHRQGGYDDAMHEMAATYAHEVVHGRQHARVDQRRAMKPGDQFPVQGMVRAIDRMMLPKQSRNTVKRFDPEFSHLDAVEKIKIGSYMAMPTEIEAHALNVANDLARMAPPREALKWLAWLFRNPRQIPDNTSLYQAYRTLQKNTYIDTEKAWKRFLKKVAQHVVRIEPDQERVRHGDITRPFPDRPAP